MERLLEIKSDFNGLDYRFESLEKNLPVMEKITAMEFQIADLQRKLAAMA